MLEWYQILTQRPDYCQQIWFFLNLQEHGCEKSFITKMGRQVAKDI